MNGFIFIACLSSMMILKWILEHWVSMRERKAERARRRLLGGVKCDICDKGKIPSPILLWTCPICNGCGYRTFNESGNML